MYKLAIFRVEKPIIGMVHLKPLPGSPNSLSFSEVLEHALEDAEALVTNEIDGLIVENFMDSPFYPRRVPPHVISSISLIAWEIKKRFSIPVGVNVLRNDAMAAIGIASIAGAEFIRVNIHIGCTVTDQGIIEGEAYRTIRYREFLKSNVKIFADIAVKHGRPLYDVPITQLARETYYRGRADALIITGPYTGAEVSIDDLLKVREAVPDAPIIIGSGVNPSNIGTLLKYADAAIVGTYIKRNGIVWNPVDPERVRLLMKVVKELR
ncbi:MAG: BtpA/SgcQ family protein [Thaumarchaeota archaeon]|nr:BtpA/SgcQ family protein [Candidatus Geocrenenecus arthurdayi]